MNRTKQICSSSTSLKIGITDIIACHDQVVVFGGGSFGTAMAAALAGQKHSMEVVLLLRDIELCNDINNLHRNARYLPVSMSRMSVVLVSRLLSHGYLILYQINTSS
jgi:voltage-gated potassium channel Kch